MFRYQNFRVNGTHMRAPFKTLDTMPRHNKLNIKTTGTGRQIKTQKFQN